MCGCCRREVSDLVQESTEPGVRLLGRNRLTATAAFWCRARDTRRNNALSDGGSRRTVTVGLEFLRPCRSACPLARCWTYTGRSEQDQLRSVVRAKVRPTRT